MYPSPGEVLVLLMRFNSVSCNPLSLGPLLRTQLCILDILEISLDLLLDFQKPLLLCLVVLAVLAGL